MRLEKLYKMQHTLDQNINKTKGLEGKKLLSEKLTALFAELGELANEWRGFKFWSENQVANTGGVVCCDRCDGSGSETFQKMASGKVFATSFKKCIECGGAGKYEEENRVLSEYVDCIHFVLSIGLEIGTRLFTVKPYRVEDTNEQFQRVYIDLARLTISAQTKEKTAYMQDDFEDVLNSLAGLGESLGFTLLEIEAAYYEKNAVNHERQVNGY